MDPQPVQQREKLGFMHSSAVLISSLSKVISKGLQRRFGILAGGGYLEFGTAGGLQAHQRERTARIRERTPLGADLDLGSKPAAEAGDIAGMLQVQPPLAQNGYLGSQNG